MLRQMLKQRYGFSNVNTDLEVRRQFSTNVNANLEMWVQRFSDVNADINARQSHGHPFFCHLMKEWILSQKPRIDELPSR